MAGYSPKGDNELQGAETSINLEVIAFNIVRGWWMIALCFIISAMLSYIFISERYVPKFKSEATLVVSSNGGGSDQVYNNLVVASRLAQSFTFVLESPVLQQKIAETLELETFDGEIEATNVENTNIIQVSVTASSPKIAFDEMNGVINKHRIVSENIMGSALLEILKAPTVPTEPLKQMDRGSRVIKYSLIASMGVIAAIAVFSIASDRIMTERDLDTKVDCHALAVIYHERKNLSLRARLSGIKTSMLITNPTTSFRFAETYRLFRTRLEYLTAKKGHKVIMISSVYENEGKTTSAANTAITLALNNKKVLLMDGDMLKPAIYKVMTTRVRRGKAINEIVQSDVPMEDIPTYEGLPTLSLLLGRTAISNSTELIGSNEMRDFMDRAKDYFDYIVIDTPPIALASDAECFAEIADCMILVIKQGGARAKRINESLEAIGRSGADIMGCIFNNVYPLEFLGTQSTDASPRQNYRTVSDNEMPEAAERE